MTSLTTLVGGWLRRFGTKSNQKYRLSDVCPIELTKIIDLAENNVIEVKKQSYSVRRIVLVNTQFVENQPARFPSIRSSNRTPFVQ